ncbi:hypothetical protein [Streptomyces filamentosus]
MSRLPEGPEIEARERDALLTAAPALGASLLSVRVQGDDGEFCDG